VLVHVWGVDVHVSGGGGRGGREAVRKDCKRESGWRLQRERGALQLLQKRALIVFVPKS
jgi:hypothetical protein